MHRLSNAIRMNYSIIFQGPTTYCKQVLTSLNTKHEVIYSTWENEPEDNLNFIEKNVSKLILNKTPEYHGKNHINLQCHSAKNGILNASNNLVFKSRSDILFTNIDLLLEKIALDYKSNLSFLYYHIFCHPYQISDFFTFGTKEENILFWDYQQTPNQYFLPYADPECPERQLIYNYMLKKDRSDINKFLEEDLNYFAKYLIEEKCDLIWLKHTYHLGGSLFKDWKKDITKS